jgi:hypothetical protein
MNNKLYVIVRISHEYNDEIYQSGQSEGGVPEQVFEDKELAEQACLERNALEFKGLNVKDYCYNINEILDRTHTLEELKSIIPNINFDEGSYELIIPQKLSLSKLMRVAKIFSELKFYQVYEVEN